MAEAAPVPASRASSERAGGAPSPGLNAPGRGMSAEGGGLPDITDGPGAPAEADRVSSDVAVDPDGLPAPPPVGESRAGPKRLESPPCEAVVVDLGAAPGVAPA